MTTAARRERILISRDPHVSGLAGPQEVFMMDTRVHRHPRPRTVGTARRVPRLRRLAAMLTLAFATLATGAYTFHNGALTAAGTAAPAVGVWMTTADQSKLLQPQPNLVFAPDTGTNPLTVTVDPTQTFQQMDGFGASFTDS